MARAKEDLECLSPTSSSADEAFRIPPAVRDDMWQWRQTIRDQVEEELERQVRLRLGISALHAHCKQVTSVANPHPHQHLQRTAVDVLQHGGFSSRNLQTLENPQKKIRFDTASQHVHKPHNLEHKGSHSEACRKFPDPDTFLQTTRQELDQNSEIPDIEHWKLTNANGKESAVPTPRNQEIILPGILDYVHVKYGTPRLQLKSLSERGQYQTNSIDTSGCGAGPEIRCPVESHVHFATPHHQSQSESVQHCETVTSRTPGAVEEHPVVAAAVPNMEHLIYSTGGELAVTGDLQFESRFESGNLQRVYQLTSREYLLMLAPDLYSKRHTQWFYFELRGMVANESYTFHIANFLKPDSLYNYGMQPLLYSKKTVEMGQNGWARVGHNISYYKSKMQYIPADVKGTFHTLTWTMEFPHPEDTCYLAHCFPYPYSRLVSYISELERCPQRSRYVSRDTLCYTLAGNCCSVLTITDFDNPEEKSQLGVVITARVHPGETNSSWMMQGLIDFLVSECNHAKSLRQHYVFKVVPMLNPDGVIVGNYRTSLAGVDLNRVYKSPQASLFPTVYHTKTLIEEFMKEKRLLLYVDLHGHSRKHNVFMYGCHTPHCDHLQLLHERVIPFLLSKQAPLMFDYSSCKFNVQKCKEATGRVVTWRLGVPNSFTLESTFCGSTLTDGKHHFSVEDLLGMGRKLGETLHSYRRYLESHSYQRKIQSQIAEIAMSNLKGHNPSKRDGEVILPLISTSCKPPEGALPKHHSKKGGHRRSKILNKFMKMDITHLERESSTSGSDSDDDEFSWKIKKAKTKRKMRSLQQAKMHSNLSRLVKMVRSQESAQPIREHDKTSYSAPARLLCDRDAAITSSKSSLPSTWKFVSKYQERSNGGIPIFSEERIKERKEKKLLQSQSFFQPTDSRSEKTEGIVNPTYSSKCKWPVQLAPIGTCRSTQKNVSSSKIPGQSKEHLKLSPQLAKYISDIWKSYSFQ